MTRSGWCHAIHTYFFRENCAPDTTDYKAPQAISSLHAYRRDSESLQKPIWSILWLSRCKGLVSIIPILLLLNKPVGFGRGKPGIHCRQPFSPCFSRFRCWAKRADVAQLPSGTPLLSSVNPGSRLCRRVTEWDILRMPGWHPPLTPNATLGLPLDKTQPKTNPVLTWEALRGVRSSSGGLRICRDFSDTCLGPI